MIKVLFISSLSFLNVQRDMDLSFLLITMQCTQLHANHTVLFILHLFWDTDLVNEIEHGVSVILSLCNAAPSVNWAYTELNVMSVTWLGK